MNKEIIPHLVLLPAAEAAKRRDRVVSIIRAAGIDAVLITTNVNLYYLTGRVFSGYAYITVDGGCTFFVKRPVDMQGDNVVYVRKPEQLAAEVTLPASIGLELNTLSYSTVERLKAVFPGARLADASAVMMQARAVKTPYEIEMIKISGAKHDRVYRMIPKLFSPGMSDYELQIEIERVMRQEGCLGQMRVSGESMEIHMGNLLAGDNADVPSPYDFTMGGAGMDPSMPVGADGSLLRPGQTVMADMNGNFDGYMTDMSRVFALGDIPAQAYEAQKCSIEICDAIAAMALPGVEVKRLCEVADTMVSEARLEAYFMGHRQKASFIGHGVGIEINERPVLTIRSREVLEEGNVIAVEPKFVIPHVGAVGIEDTYVVTAHGMEPLTHAPREIIKFD